MFKIGNKTPAQLHNDLFAFNNNNEGVDGVLRPVYSGNGTPLPIEISIDQVAIDFNKGAITRPIIDSSHMRLTDIGDKTGAYQISTTGGNVQKIRLTGNVTMTVLSDVDTDAAFEITLIVEQSSGGNTITFGSGFLKPGGAAISFSATAGAIDILKLLTYDGGTTWLVYKIASDVR